jgi:simple sugar transport system permease protein
MPRPSLPKNRRSGFSLVEVVLALGVVAAAVLGGASLLGGIGSVSGVVLGIFLLAILRNGLNLLGVSPYFFQIVIGLILLASTGITGLSLRRRRVAEA